MVFYMWVLFTPKKEWVILKLKRLAAFIVAITLAVVSFAVPIHAKNESEYYIKTLFENVNVRTGPGTAYDLIGKAVYGAKYPCLGTAFSSDGTMWYKIDIANADDGWVSSDYAHRYETKIKNAVEPTSETKSNSKIDQKLQKYINSLAEEYHAIGVQVAVIRGEDGKIFNWNYGYATRGTKPMTTNTKIRTASLSKVAVAMCAVKMHEEGLVSLNADIGKYWDAELPKKVTLKNLLTHTSTLRYLSFKNTAEGTLKQLVDENSYLEGTAGDSSVWSYNNYAFGVAGSTLELAAGETLESYMQKYFFDPIGINVSFYSGSFSDNPRIATLYESDGGVERTVREAKAIIGSGIAGNNTSIHAGSLTASAKDIAKLFYVLANDGSYGGEQLLSEKSVKTMEKKYFKTTENGGKFTQCTALRYAKNRYGAEKLYYHTGNAYGAISMASYDAKTGDVVVVMTTGANPKRDKYGVYELCSKITKKMYRNMEKLGS